MVFLPAVCRNALKSRFARALPIRHFATRPPSTKGPCKEIVQKAADIDTNVGAIWPPLVERFTALQGLLPKPEYEDFKSTLQSYQQEQQTMVKMIQSWAFAKQQNYNDSQDRLEEANRALGKLEGKVVFLCNHWASYDPNESDREKVLNVVESVSAATENIAHQQRFAEQEHERLQKELCELKEEAAEREKEMMKQVKAYREGRDEAKEKLLKATTKWSLDETQAKTDSNRYLMEKNAAETKVCQLTKIVEDKKKELKDAEKKR